MSELNLPPGVVVNERGGKQAHIATRLTLIPPKALLRVGAILSVGATKYGADNWRLISWQEHLDHALEHATQLLAKEQSQDHFGNFACRSFMALEMYIEESQNG